MAGMKKTWNVKVIRYADDIVVMAAKLDHIKMAEKRLKAYLVPIGLELSEKKTRIGHTQESINGEKPGIDYLGYHFQNYPTGRHTGVKSTSGKKHPFKKITKPSAKAVEEHKAVIKKTLIEYKNAPLPKIIEALSSIIKGWTYYHAVTQATDTFTKLDGWLWKRLWHWAVKRYKKASRAKKACFSVQGWKFGFQEKGTKKKWVLKRYDQTRVRKYIKIKANASMYDPKLTLYFADRVSANHPMFKRLKGILDKQKGKCAYCGIHFKPDEIIELHHVLDNEKKKG